MIFYNAKILMSIKLTNPIEKVQKKKISHSKIVLNVLSTSNSSCHSTADTFFVVPLLNIKIDGAKDVSPG